MIRDPRIPRLVGLTQAAEIVGVSRQYVYQLVQDNQLPACMDTGTMVLLEEAVRTYKAQLDLERGPEQAEAD